MRPLEGRTSLPTPAPFRVPRRHPSASGSRSAPIGLISCRPQSCHLLSLWNTPCFLRSVLILVPSAIPLLSPPRPLPALGAPRGGSRCCSFSAPGAPRWPSGAGSTSCPPWPGPGHTMIPSPDSGRAMARHRISGCRRHLGGDVIMGDSGVTFWGPGCFSSGWDHSRPMGLPCGQYRHEGDSVGHVLASGPSPRGPCGLSLSPHKPKWVLRLPPHFVSQKPKLRA